MILITGANGLLGSFIAKTFLDEGKEVVGLVRGNADLTLLPSNHPQLKLHSGDILDIPSLISLFEENPVEYVIHTAAIVSFKRTDRESMERVNVEGTKNIINTCLKYPVKKFIHISSVAAIGRNASGILNEETEWKSSDYNSYYGITKYDAEMEVWRAQIEGLSTVIVNPSVILAAGDGERSSSRFLTYLTKKPKFYPMGNFNYVDIRDVAQIVKELTFNNTENQRFILNAGTVTYQEFFQKAAEAKGIRPPSIPVNKLLGKVALFGENLRSKFLKREPLLTTETLRTSRSKVSFDNQKITNFLNYKFRPLEESLQWVWKEFNSRGGVEK